MNKTVIIAIVVVFFILAGILAVSFINQPQQQTQNVQEQIQQTQNQIQNQVKEVKEFKMTSFYEILDGKPKPQYSINEITVKKGDAVKIEVTVTKGNHDFNIDEYNIHQETPLEKPTVIQFTADKPGTFIYYCSMPGHRENGHWGTLTVTE